MGAAQGKKKKVQPAPKKKTKGSKNKGGLEKSRSGMSEVEEKPVAPEGTCGYFIKKRGHFCKFSLVTGQSFCSTHLKGEDDAARVACPVDGKHSIYLKDVRKHLRKCPRVRDVAGEALLPLYHEKCNIMCTWALDSNRNAVSQETGATQNPAFSQGKSCKQEHVQQNESQDINTRETTAADKDFGAQKNDVATASLAVPTSASEDPLIDTPMMESFTPTAQNNPGSTCDTTAMMKTANSEAEEKKVSVGEKELSNKNKSSTDQSGKKRKPVSGKSQMELEVEHKELELICKKWIPPHYQQVDTNLRDSKSRGRYYDVCSEMAKNDKQLKDWATKVETAYRTMQRQMGMNTHLLTYANSAMFLVSKVSKPGEQKLSKPDEFTKGSAKGKPLEHDKPTEVNKIATPTKITEHGKTQDHGKQAEHGKYGAKPTETSKRSEQNKISGDDAPHKTSGDKLFNLGKSGNTTNKTMSGAKVSETAKAEETNKVVDQTLVPMNDNFSGDRTTDVLLRHAAIQERARHLIEYCCLQRRGVAYDGAMQLHALRGTLTKDELQGLSLWAHTYDMYTRPQADSAAMLVVELGAGKGGLTQWLVEDVLGDHRKSESKPAPLAAGPKAAIGAPKEKAPVAAGGTAVWGEKAGEEKPPAGSLFGFALSDETENDGLTAMLPAFGSTESLDAMRRHSRSSIVAERNTGGLFGRSESLMGEKKAKVETARLNFPSAPAASALAPIDISPVPVPIVSAPAVSAPAVSAPAVSAPTVSTPAESASAISAPFAPTQSARKNPETFFILVERESRQNNKEAKDAKAHKDLVRDRSMARLRVDLAHFDLYRLIQCVLSKEQRRGLILDRQDSDRTPWIVSLLKEAGAFPAQTAIEETLMRVRSEAHDMSMTLREKIVQGCQKLHDAGVKASMKNQLQCLLLAKHLCGCASDIALMSADRLVSRMAAASSDSAGVLVTFVMVPCCFHGCLEDMLCGVEYLREVFGDAYDVAKVFGCVGWSTGTTDIRRLIGTQTKAMMHMARAMWLKARGWEVTLENYISSDITLENLVYKATKRI